MWLVLPQHAQRLAPHSDQAAAQHLHFGREALARRLQVVDSSSRPVAVSSSRMLMHLGARDSVDGGVMHLRQHRHRAVLQPVDDVDLPQRARPIQLPTDQVSHQVGQLPLSARRRAARRPGRGTRHRRCRRRPSTGSRGRTGRGPAASGRSAAGACARSPVHEPAPHPAGGPTRLSASNIPSTLT